MTGKDMGVDVKGEVCYSQTEAETVMLRVTGSNVVVAGLQGCPMRGKCVRKPGRVSCDRF